MVALPAKVLVGIADEDARRPSVMGAHGLRPLDLQASRHGAWCLWASCGKDFPPLWIRVDDPGKD